MKRMYTIIALLLVCLGFGYFQKGNQPQAQVTKPRVGVLNLMHHPSLDQIYAGFRAQMAAEGYHDGKNVTIEYQNAQGDQSNLQTMAHKLIDSQPDVLYGITTPASQALASTTSKVPILLGAVTNPQGAGLIKNNRHPGGNITGISNQAPVKEQFNLVLKFMPHVKKLGIIYTSSDLSASTEQALFVKEARKHHIELKSYAITNSNDLNQVSQQCLSEVEGVIVATDNTIAGAMQTLIKNANAVNKPVFPAVDAMVKQGGVATYGINQYRLGQEGAKMTVAVLRGDKKPATTAIKYLRHGEPILNLKQAQKLGLKVPAGFQHEAETEGKVYK
ncbi:ABC transporter substrate-binding protein [Lactobacillus sp. DCY120]|uniref:ABC transporter substrate-binding protein n=1 Tax=Bombilactobacillus apium TaxID=2675299 RepID=A0A850R184_9LACO|nr:tryptophan ABC transporter substrate-binding protein [Bombilactobacillus apium]NVY96120.1 ABC transporter substrate-binding protein [Bombilactobacillus apium]